MRQKRRVPPRDLVRQQGPTAPDDNATRRPHTEAAGTKRPWSAARYSAADHGIVYLRRAHMLCSGAVSARATTIKEAVCPHGLGPPLLRTTTCQRL